jgi:hypothetical protein
MDPFDVGGLWVARNRAIVRVVVGLGVAAFAGLLSLALYWNAGLEAQAAAEASPTGEGSGTYFVLWGPALWGPVVHLGRRPGPVGHPQGPPRAPRVHGGALMTRAWGDNDRDLQRCPSPEPRRRARPQGPRSVQGERGPVGPPGKVGPAGKDAPVPGPGARRPGASGAAESNRPSSRTTARPAFRQAADANER